MRNIFTFLVFFVACIALVVGQSGSTSVPIPSNGCVNVYVTVNADSTCDRKCAGASTGTPAQPPPAAQP